MKNKKTLLISIIILIIALFPVYVTCKAPNYTCTPAPDSEGNISRTVDIEPAFVYIIELIIQKDFPLAYTSYESIENINN